MTRDLPFPWPLKFTRKLNAVMDSTDWMDTEEFSWAVRRCNGRYTVANIRAGIGARRVDCNDLIEVFAVLCSIYGVNDDVYKHQDRPDA